jgi:transposase
MTKFSEEFKAKMSKKGFQVKQFKCHFQRIWRWEKNCSRWCARYEAGGTDQLLRVNRRYTPEFKKKVIEYRWEHGLSLTHSGSPV